jgi:hypothetical protein
MTEKERERVRERRKRDQHRRILPTHLSGCEQWEEDEVQDSKELGMGGLR